MSEPAPPAVPEHTPEGHAGSLTPETVERVLADFRQWLDNRRDEPGGSAADAPPDLHTLLGQMIAVRQEVNLQTKAVRAQQEQNAGSLELLEEALRDLQKSKSAPQQTQSPDDLLRPLVKTLLDVHDALSLAAKEIQRIEDIVLASLAEPPAVPDLSDLRLADVRTAPLEQPPRPILARLLGVRAVSERTLDDWQTQTRSALENAALEKLDAFTQAWKRHGEESRREAERIRQLLASLLSGYKMGLQRIERAMQQHGLEAISAAGETFDPERMEVLEAVEGTGLPSGEVLDEIRRGYLWRGRVLRYAQVRVARS